MPISHASIIHKPNDYTTPVDLNLLGRVLETKQSQFDQGVNKVQGAIDQASSLDVVRGVDKDYLNSKINNLVETTNNIGGVDYSDPNITNQIAGLAPQIYNDPTVINAIAGTRAFRYVQDQYKTLKEKNPKNWNPANEWYDMNKFSDWFNDDKAGASVGAGAGEITPYVKYEDDWSKLFEKIAAHPNVSTTITDKGLMYRIDTQKIVSPDQIWDTAQKMLTPEQRQQLAIEGRYQYQNLPVSDLTKAYDAETYKKVGVATSQLDDYKTKLKASVNIQDQDKYQQLIDSTTNQINTLLSPVRKNAEQIKENLYLNDKLKGLQDRYAFSEATTKLQPATDKMFKLKYEMDKQKFAYQQGHDAKQQEIEMAKDGLMYFQDDFGHTTIIQDPNARQNNTSRGRVGKNGQPDYSGLPGYNAAKTTQANEVTKDNLDSRKTDLVAANEQLKLQYAKTLAHLKDDDNVTTSDLLPNGHIVVNLTPEMRAAMQQKFAALDSLTQGKQINFEQLDPEFKSYAKKYQENQKEIEAIDNYYTGIDKQIQQKYGATPDKLAKYNAVQAIQKEHDLFSSGRIPNRRVNGKILYGQQVIDNANAQKAQKLAAIGASPDGELPGIDSKAMSAYLQNRDSERNALIGSASEVFRAPRVTITDDKDKNIAKMLEGNVKSGNLHAYNEDGTENQGFSSVGLNMNNIQVIDKGYSTLEGNLTPTVTVNYKTGNKPEDYKVLRIPVDPSQQQILGFGNEVKPFSGYDFALRLNGKVNDLVTTSGRNYELKYDMVKVNPDDPNDKSVFLRIHNKAGNKIILNNMYMPTYVHAQNAVEALTRFKTIDEAIDNISKMAPSNK